MQKFIRRAMHGRKDLSFRFKSFKFIFCKYSSVFKNLLIFGFALWNVYASKTDLFQQYAIKLAMF